jgi:hypothetical protein
MEKYFTAIGGTLSAAFIIWMTSSQLSITTSLARIQDKQLHFTSRLDMVWPRLRSHGEDIAILQKEIEKLCQCSIQLTRPERF